MASDVKERDSLRRFDRMLLQSALDGHHLRPYVPLEPNGLAAAEGAGMVVPFVLEALQEAHRVDAWTPETFERVFLGEAIAAWHGGLEIEHRGDSLVARTPSCPVAAEARRDARVCQMCRALHTVAAQEAFGWRLRGVTFPRLITQGDGACEVHVAAAPAEAGDG
jgi:hypothetical protein